MKITLEKAKKDHAALLRQANYALRRDDYNLVFSLVSCIANQAYHLNYCYADSDLEDLLAIVSSKLIGKSESKPEKSKYVFYDDFGYDNRGLTQQYLHALDELNVQYLYLVDSVGFNKGGSIGRQLSANPNAKIVEVPQEFNPVEKFQFIYKILSEYNPEKSFLHLTPWSSVAVSIWHAFPKVEKYLIDLTDHAFWLGVSCSDYFIGFRDYGHNISIDERKVNAEKLLHLPYYPVISSDEFKGFPVEVRDRVKIFSGGAYYKVYGENDEFFKILLRIAKENPGVVILFAGSGDSKPFESYINKNNLGNNVYLIGNRVDINEVFKNSDIYLNTYPIIGGLMSQYAVMNKKPLIGYTTKDIPCNASEGLFSKDLHYQTTYYELEEFHEAMNGLIESSGKRIESSSYDLNILPSPESFASDFAKMLAEKKPANFKELSIDIKRFSSVYLSMENDYLHKYHAIKFRHLGLKSFIYLPVDSIVSMANVVFYNFGYLIRYFKGDK